MLIIILDYLGVLTITIIRSMVKPPLRLLTCSSLLLSWHLSLVLILFIQFLPNIKAIDRIDLV